MKDTATTKLRTDISNSEINKDVFYLLCLRKLIWLFPVILTLLQSIFLHIGTSQLISFANKSTGM